MASSSSTPQKPPEQRYAIFVILGMFDNRFDILEAKVAKRRVHRILAVFSKKESRLIPWRIQYGLVFHEVRLIRSDSVSCQQNY